MHLSGGTQRRKGCKDRKGSFGPLAGIVQIASAAITPRSIARAGSSDQGSFAAFALLRVFAFFRSDLTSRISALDIDRLSERRAEPVAAVEARLRGRDVDVDDRRRPLLQLVRELGVLGLLAI
jgi:hypothetical protein